MLFHNNHWFLFSGICNTEQITKGWLLCHISVNRLWAFDSFVPWCEQAVLYFSAYLFSSTFHKCWVTYSRSWTVFPLTFFSRFHWVNLRRLLFQISLTYDCTMINIWNLFGNGKFVKNFWWFSCNKIYFFCIVDCHWRRMWNGGNWIVQKI